MTVGLLVASCLNGLRHGIDIDHVAAITDITASQLDRRRALLLSTSYALGHALVVLILGAIAVLVGARIPDSVDVWMGRMVGVTLILLGAYVLYSIVRYRRAELESRWTLLMRGARALWGRLRPSRDLTVIEHEHEHAHGGLHTHEHLDSVANPGAVSVRTRTHSHLHRHIASVPGDPFTEYGLKGSFMIGMMHGVGAETPTQLLLFLTAAGISSKAVGMIVVMAFLLGMLLSNTAIAVAAGAGFAGGNRFPKLYFGLAVATGVFSLLLGFAYVAGSGALIF